MNELTFRGERRAIWVWRVAVIVLLLWNLWEAHSTREAARGAENAAAAAQHAVGALREDLDDALSGDGPADEATGTLAPTKPGASLREGVPTACAAAV